MKPALLLQFNPALGGEKQQRPEHPNAVTVKVSGCGDLPPLHELIEQLESIAEQLESDELEARRRKRQKRYSNREAIAQVAGLAHREKLPETTAALGVFLNGWETALDWVGFDQLVDQWEVAAAADLDRDRVGVFWALLFLSSQGRVELVQEGWLHGPLRLKLIPASGTATQLPIRSLQVPDPSPTRTVVAA